MIISSAVRFVCAAWGLVSLLHQQQIEKEDEDDGEQIKQSNRIKHVPKEERKEEKEAEKEEQETTAARASLI